MLLLMSLLGWYSFSEVSINIVRRGVSLPQPAGPGQAHVRAGLPRRPRYAAIAAGAELGGPARLSSLPAGPLRSPAGAGTLGAPIGAAGPGPVRGKLRESRARLRGAPRPPGLASPCPGQSTGLGGSSQILWGIQRLWGV